MMKLPALLNMAALDELFSKAEVRFINDEPAEEIRSGALLRESFKDREQDLYIRQEWPSMFEPSRRELTGKERRKRKKKRVMANKSRKRNRK